MEKIIEKSYHIDLNDVEQIIRYYNQHQSYFDNYKHTTDTKTTEEIILFKQNLCEALEKKSHYTDAQIVLANIFSLLSEIKEVSTQYDRFYERALFYEGVLFGRKKNYRASNERFELLLQIDPKNEKYRDWYNVNREWIMHQQFRYIDYGLMFILLFILTIGDKVLGHYYFYVLVVAFVIYLGWFSFRYFKERSFRNRK